MKTTCILALAGLAALSAAHAQDPAPPAPAAEAKKPSARETAITSDTFRLDLEKKTGLFTGNVVVQDKDFGLNCEEITVTFDESNKVQSLVARGKVNLKQGRDRTGTCREAEYFVAEKKLVLRGEPVLFQNLNKLEGTIITLYPETNRLEIDGRSKAVFTP
jgi:lipopolysaccharide transport protein LptA